MSKLLDIKAFNTAHYPIGSSVLITRHADPKHGIEENSEAGVILHYDVANTVMLVLTVSDFKNRDMFQQFWCPSYTISVNDIAEGTISLQRLLPESPEVEEMDYESALNEVLGTK